MIWQPICMPYLLSPLISCLQSLIGPDNGTLPPGASVEGSNESNTILIVGGTFLEFGKLPPCTHGHFVSKPLVMIGKLTRYFLLLIGLENTRLLVLVLTLKVLRHN
ncbi:hypothetical protein DFH27DRAFT_316051 [Peziza echinospora]|nr:hypothetical protein DFH27DRAFT_316051 [Peziza echinospora]